MSAAKKFKLSNTVSGDGIDGDFSGAPSTSGLNTTLDKTTPGNKAPDNTTPGNKAPDNTMIMPEEEESSTIGIKELKLKGNKFFNAEKKDAATLIWLVAMAKKATSDKRINFVEGAKFFKTLFKKCLETDNIHPPSPNIPLEVLVQDPLSLPQSPNQQLPSQQQSLPATLQQDKEDDNSSYQYELRIQIDIVYRYLLGCFETKRTTDASAALDAVMTMFVAEADNPGIGIEPEFLFSRFCSILEALLSTDINTPPVINLFKEYTKKLDVLHFVWKLIPRFIKSPMFTCEIYVNNIFALIRSSNPKDLTRSNRYLCGAGEEFYTNQQLKIYINRVWQMLLQSTLNINKNQSLHRQMLLALNEVFIDYVDNLLGLTDFLMDSVEFGGAISLLSLHGIYVLMQTQNISFPDIYKKLYFMFEPEVFASKYKPRLIYLADLFLSSTHLPEALIAAFIKRLARITLNLNSNDITVLVSFIRILIQRHPSLKNLVIAKQPYEVKKDPFIMDESEPTESKALESFLWEIDLLKEHAIPEVSNAAWSLFNFVPIQESELFKILDEKRNELFNEATISIVQKISRNYNTPYGFYLPEFDKFKNRWDLF